MEYLKAIYGSVMAGIGSTSAAYVASGGHIGLVAGLTIAGTIITAFGAVFGVTNAPSTDEYDYSAE